MSEAFNPFDDPDVVRRLLDDGTVLFAALADDGTILWIGESSLFLLGRAAADLIGQNMVDLLHVDDHNVVIETMAEGARGAEGRIRVALRLRHEDGSWVSLEFGGIDLRDDDGRGVFLVWGSPNNASERMLSFVNALLAGADLDHLLAQVAIWHDTTTPGTLTTILVREPDGGYRNRARTEALPAALAIDLAPRRGPDPTPWGQAVQTGATTVLTDLDQLPADLASVARDHGFQAVWVVPVVSPGRSHPSGLVVAWRLRPGTMLATHRRQLDTTIQTMRLAIEWWTVQEELVGSSRVDLQACKLEYSIVSPK